MFATSLMSVSPNVDAVEEDGKASDCVRMARTVVTITAAEFGHDPNVDYFEGYLELYNNLYQPVTILNKE